MQICSRYFCRLHSKNLSSFVEKENKWELQDKGFIENY
jgi:hypothetical protein